MVGGVETLGALTTWGAPPTHAEGHAATDQRRDEHRDPAEHGRVTQPDRRERKWECKGTGLRRPLMNAPFLRAHEGSNSSAGLTRSRWMTAPWPRSERRPRPAQKARTTTAVAPSLASNSPAPATQPATPTPSYGPASAAMAVKAAAARLPLPAWSEQRAMGRRQRRHVAVFALRYLSWAVPSRSPHCACARNRCPGARPSVFRAGDGTGRGGSLEASGHDRWLPRGSTCRCWTAPGCRSAGRGRRGPSGESGRRDRR